MGTLFLQNLITQNLQKLKIVTLLLRGGVHTRCPLSMDESSMTRCWLRGNGPICWWWCIYRCQAAVGPYGCAYGVYERQHTTVMVQMEMVTCSWDGDGHYLAMAVKKERYAHIYIFVCYKSVSAIGKESTGARWFIQGGTIRNGSPKDDNDDLK